MDRPLILVTNDDGVNAPGIQACMEAACEVGDVVVVAPDSAQSGMGHAITIDSTLRVKKVKEEPGLRVYSCSGTPVDCVKLSSSVMLDRAPDLLLSGVNHGANQSINVIYSGTMSAAIEGAMEGIPAIGFSLCDWSIDADFSASKKVVATMAKKVLQEGLPDKVCLNVNIPKLHWDEIMGFKMCRQANAIWEEDFDERKDPRGASYYWLTGRFENRDPGPDTDVWALENNYVSVVPTQFDMTAYKALSDLSKWKF